MNTDLKNLIRRVPEEVYNQGNLAAVDELFLPDYIEHRPLPPNAPKGSQIPRMMAQMLRTAFPDLQMTVDDVMSEGDKAVARLTVQGTHTGEFQGMPATGRRIVWTETHMVRCENGKIAEHWVNLDELGRMNQMGAG
ncbi:MAG: ester cyclase [Anaerolineae bacterium]|nr:ester cyclase [Anaerolineae bacterium]